MRGKDQVDSLCFVIINAINNNEAEQNGHIVAFKLNFYASFCRFFFALLIYIIMS